MLFGISEENSLILCRSCWKFFQFCLKSSQDTVRRRDAKAAAQSGIYNYFWLRRLSCRNVPCNVCYSTSSRPGYSCRLDRGLSSWFTYTHKVFWPKYVSSKMVSPISSDALSTSIVVSQRQTTSKKLSWNNCNVSFTMNQRETVCDEYSIIVHCDTFFIGWLYLIRDS